MKKKNKILRGIIIGVIVLLVVGAGVLYATGAFGSSAAASTTTYQISKLMTGDLEKSVTGTGTLAAGGTASVTAPADITVDSIKITAGQSIKKGDVLATVDTKELDTTIATLQSSITSLDKTLQQLAGNESSTETVTSNIEGRVKQIFAQAGGDVKTVMAASGGIMVLSTDEKMRLDCTLKDGADVSPGMSVTVKTGGKSYTGLVVSLSDDNKTALITLTDNGPKLDSEATIMSGDIEIGSGKLAINNPVYITATSGTIKKLNVSENKKIYKGSTLYYLKNIPYSQDYSYQANSRAKLAGQLQTALQIQKTGTLLAEADGIVNEITFADNTAYTYGTVLFTLLTGGPNTLDVSIDELDIASVQVGQDVTVSVDALSDQTFTGKVTAISQVGATTNGVTTYPVTVVLSDDGNLKVGMSATATIVIEKHSGVLLLPLEALQSSKGEQYVWLYTGTLPEDSSTDPGTRTVVEVGLSNENYVEVTSGLTAQDQVVIVRTRSTSTNGSSNRQGNNVFGGMSQMPPQGQFRRD